MLIMWSLPDCATVWIFAHLEVKDVAAAAVVSKYFSAIVRSKELVALLFERDLFLFTCYSTPSTTLNVSYSAQCELLKTIRRMNEEWLDYKGFATNGGVDEDDPHFWLGKVFQKLNSSGYCTQENVRNVNIAGVLKAAEEQIAEQGATQMMKRRLTTARSKLERESSQLKAMLDNEDLLQMYGADLLKQIAANMPELLVFEGEDEVDMQKSVREALKYLLSKSPKLQQLLQRPDNHLVLAEHVSLPAFPACTRLSFIKSVRISRKGGFTCPVGTIMVFTSLSYVDVESPLFEVYNNLWTVENVRALVDSAPSVPPLYHIETQESHTFCEFRGKAGCELQPLLWLTFSPQEDIRKKALTVHLQQVFPSLYLYAKLISPEDRREERGWQHEFMNIDVKYVAVKGQVIEVDAS
jgi:hypothetical protein